MIDDIKNTAREKMNSALEFVRVELSSIRSGRANPGMLENIRAEAYGSTMPIKELANINTPEPRQFMLQVWDVANTGPISKALQASGLGLNPQVEGQMIRVNLPPLTEETRKNLVKVVGEKAEEGKVRLRQARQEANKDLQGLKSAGKISEDIQKSAEVEIQKIHDEVMKHIDESKALKERELQEI